MTNKVITISRQFGSGGRTIGKKVAEKLGIPYYDKELVDQVAKESGFSHEFIEEIGEYASVTSSFLFNIAVSAHPMGLIDTMSVSDKLYVCQTNVIRDLAAKGPCVIVEPLRGLYSQRPSRYAAHLHPLRYGAPRRAYCAPVR
ncbi:MAG: AAA family ATPase [Oscillospiraceae bacterium]